MQSMPLITEHDFKDEITNIADRIALLAAQVAANIPMDEAKKGELYAMFKK